MDGGFSGTAEGMTAAQKIAVGSLIVEKVIADGVAYMREIAHGHPMELTFEEWLVVLQEIEDGMRAALRIHDDMLYGDEADAEMEKFNLAMDHLKKWWFSLWD